MTVQMSSGIPLEKHWNPWGTGKTSPVGPGVRRELTGRKDDPPQSCMCCGARPTTQA